VVGALATRFLTGCDNQDDTRSLRQFLVQFQDGNHEGSDAAFHIRRSAAVELSIGNFAGKGVHCPGRRPQWDGIDVSRETEWFGVRRDADTGDEASSVFRELVIGDGKSAVF
ncbi:uncharacterized protein METZ01_LOCUS458206, partial [marine metagenome]